MTDKDPIEIIQDVRYEQNLKHKIKKCNLKIKELNEQINALYYPKSPLGKAEGGNMPESKESKRLGLIGEIEECEERIRHYHQSIEYLSDSKRIAYYNDDGFMRDYFGGVKWSNLNKIYSITNPRKYAIDKIAKNIKELDSNQKKRV